MATIASNSATKGVKEFVFEWEGKDRKGKQVQRYQALRGYPG